MPHAAQIPVTLLADIPDGDHRPAKTQARLLCRTQGPQQCYKAASVVGNSGQKQHASHSPKLKSGRGREHRVQMRSDYHWIVAEALVWSDHISNFVGRGIEPNVPQFLGERAGSFGFTKWRGRYGGQPDLIGLNLGLVPGNEPKRPLDAGICEYGFNTLTHYLITNVAGSDSIGGSVATMPTTLYVPGVTVLRSLSRSFHVISKLQFLLGRIAS
jgi:hypothetical protein